MNGREIFNFAGRTVPGDIQRALQINNLRTSDIDRFLLHQASKYMLDFLIKRTGLPKEKTPYVIENYGNTVSSGSYFIHVNIGDKNQIMKAIYLK